MTSGIYKIENKKTGQIYIGQSKNIEKRFKQHCNPLPVDVAIATEGEDNFDFSIIEETNDLCRQEKFWIQAFNAHKDEYHYNCRLESGGRLNVKYTLWDNSRIAYSKRDMYRNNREPNPCCCFAVIYERYHLPIGVFYDFTSCEIINQLIEEAIKDEIK